MQTKAKKRYYGPRQRQRAALTVEANVRMVYAFVTRSMRIPQSNPLFDDAVNEGLVVLWKCALGFRPEFGWKFSTYAYRALSRFGPRFWEKHDRHGFAGLGERTVPPPASLNGLEDFIPAPGAVVAPDYGALHSAIAQLDPRSRTIVEARLAGHSLREVGYPLGFCKESVRQFELRAHETLRTLLDTTGDTR